MRKNFKLFEELSHRDFYKIKSCFEKPVPIIIGHSVRDKIESIAETINIYNFSFSS